MQAMQTKQQRTAPSIKKGFCHTAKAKGRGQAALFFVYDAIASCFWFFSGWVND